MVVGLGNPGKEYAGTRHNVGFAVIDALSEALDIEVKRRKFGARLGEGEIDDDKLILLKPVQFMNRSGQVVATAAGFYKLPIENLLVVTDDMALDVGRIRLRAKGSAGGHNGLDDIIQKLGTEEFVRLRVGIGSAGQQDAYDYVLGRFNENESPLIEAAISRARDAILCWLKQGIETAMNEYNRADQQLS
ncbi:MAG: aminoacyl-tRNA hydrolase [Phycisphaerales bacterium]|jgi:PTH1 family peptidyl-tRNA hydrolase